ncbi:MAG TPA: hypothetical protein VK452_10580, partial [Dissulfurispiraceae bacterium]|nr:hypothetical protein [Dissulfurispiraceae bacterium]
GMFKPTDVKFYMQDRDCSGEQEKIDQCAAQMNLYNKTKDKLEPIPFYFRYSFRCANESHCPGHTLPIIDWEMGQCYRSWRTKYPEKSTLFNKIEEKWLGELCSPERDTYFFVGNMHRFQDQFLILGVFYPKKET